MHHCGGAGFYFFHGEEAIRLAVSGLHLVRVKCITAYACPNLNGGAGVYYCHGLEAIDLVSLAHLPLPTIYSMPFWTDPVLSRGDGANS